MLKLFGYFIRVPNLLIAITELLLSFVLIFYLQINGFLLIKPVLVSGDVLIILSAITSCIIMCMLFACGLYESKALYSIELFLKRITVTALFTMLPTCFVWVQTKTYNADTFYLPITYVLLVFIVIFIIRLIIHLLPKSIYATRNILVIGEEDNIKRVEAISEKSHTLKIKYTLQPDSINLNDNHLELLALCSEYNINEIIIALNEKRDVLPVHALMQCKLRGIEITDYLTLIEQETGFVDLDNFSPSWIIYSQDFSRNFASHAAKRIFDIFASLIILFLTSPILIITFFAVRQESEGGAFYKQTRVGLDGKNFEILKFRSMYIDAEKNGVQWAAENDPRITSVGKLIRKTRIDELPQLFNVLKGDMSLVGPRPERPEFVETLKQDITLYDERHLIKPGLTGWAQINNPYGASVDDTKQKLKLDLYYLKHGNIILDILILLKTLRVVFWPQGVR